MLNINKDVALETPALIVTTGSVSGLEITALTVLDRLVVTLSRAGCSPISVLHTGPKVPTKRADALGIDYRSVEQVPAFEKPTLLAEASLLVNVGDVERVIAAGGRLAGLPLGVAKEYRGSVAETLEELPSIEAEALAVDISKPEQKKNAERALWDSLTSKADGYVDLYFNRPLGRLLSLILVHTPVSPNQVTIFALLVGIVAAWFLTKGEYQATLIGFALFQLSAVIDCVDGDLARAVFKESPIGRWLDISADQVVHIGAFGAVGWGIASNGQPTLGAALAIPACIGTLLGFAFFVRSQLLAPEQRNSRLTKLLDSTANRDFTLLLLVCGLLDNMVLFLSVINFGVHSFWILCLIALMTTTVDESALESSVS